MSIAEKGEEEAFQLKIPNPGDVNDRLQEQHGDTEPGKRI
jgi:hypothetical protein